MTLDEDLQHRPEDITAMFETVARTGRDIVYSQPDTAVHTSYGDLASRSCRRIVARATGIPAVVSFSSFRLMRGSVARAAASVSGHDTYFDIALTWFTDRFESRKLNLVDARFAATARLLTVMS